MWSIRCYAEAGRKRDKRNGFGENPELRKIVAKMEAGLRKAQKNRIKKSPYIKLSD